jgi:16S rRNA (guanine527-N7)-methyltransferase
VVVPFSIRSGAALRDFGPQAASDLLAEGLSDMAIGASPVQRELLLTFLQLLLKWNNVYNLTAVRDLRDMLVVHVLDSLSILSTVDQYAGSVLLDVGSGAGLPGVPLAIMRPALKIISVDAVAKKIGFQRQVEGALKLPNFSPTHARVEALTLSEMPTAIISRAYAELPTMLESIDRHTRESTNVIAMKGIEPIDEIARLPAPWRLTEVRALEVPYLGAQRCAVVLRKTS